MSNYQASGHLTAKQTAFVHEYLIDLNASAAGRRAGFAKSTSRSQCPLWVGENRDSCPSKFHHVWDAVQAAKRNRNEALTISAQDLLYELIQLYSSDIRDAFDSQGKLRPLAQIPPSLAKLLTGYSVVERFHPITGQLIYRSAKLRFESRLQLIRLLGMHQSVKAFEESPSTNKKIDIAARILAARVLLRPSNDNQA